ncbi:MAG: hypothetical protein QM775_13915 [Pirellulales bacterium]
MQTIYAATFLVFAIADGRLTKELFRPEPEYKLVLPADLPEHWLDGTKSGQGYKVDANSEYAAFHRYGWNTYLSQYRRPNQVVRQSEDVRDDNFSSDLAVPVMQGSLDHFRAYRDGYEQCRQAIELRWNAD